jgi:chromosome segregation ATPase
MSMRTWSNPITLLVLMSLAWGPASAYAQDTNRNGDTVQAIRELTAEVRSLRAAVERADQTQVQQQVLRLGLYLTLQQGRVTQATMRLDTVRRELEGVTSRVDELAAEAARLEEQLIVETAADKRRELEAAGAATKQETRRIKAQEQQIRNRESEAFQAAQTEETRWAELSSQLEQLLKK